MYNTKDTLVFNPALVVPHQYPPAGRVGLFAFTDNIPVVIDENGLLVSLANGRTNTIGNLSGTATFDLSGGMFLTATLAANTTITFTNPPAQAGVFTLLLTNGAAFAPTWPASVLWPAGTEPTWTIAGIDQIRFTTFDGGVTWIGEAVVIAAA